MFLTVLWQGISWTYRSEITRNQTHKCERQIGVRKLRQIIQSSKFAEKSYATTHRTTAVQVRTIRIFQQPTHVETYRIVPLINFLFFLYLNFSFFRCKYCPQTFTQSSSLNIHTRTHTGEKPYICTHELCAKKFISRTSLQRHLCSHNNRKKVNLENSFSLNYNNCDMINIKTDCI